MKRFVSRHLSLRRNDYTYVPLSTSDPQLNLADRKRAPSPHYEVHAFATAEKNCSNDLALSPRDKNARKRRWFYLRRRKKTGVHDVDEYKSVERQEKTPIGGDDFEVAVEASPMVAESKLSEDVAKLPTTTGHSTDPLELDKQTLDSTETTTAATATTPTVTVNKTVAHASFPKDFPCRLERRFAICEELEREIIMEDGTNLRKSRKNLVIRQVLHDLLLL